MFEIIIGIVIGYAAGILTAIFWPKRWAKYVNEVGEEVKRP